MKSIKTKIFGGLAFLFIVILILSISGIIFLNKLSQGSKGTIKNNYASIQYTVEMLRETDNVYSLVSNLKYTVPAKDTITKVYDTSKKILFENLNLQSNNITEVGEAAVCKKLQVDCAKFIALSDSIITNEKEIKNDILLQNFNRTYKEFKNEISIAYGLNMRAVLRRNETADKTADSAIIIMGIVGALSIIITLSFILGFPNRIINPIKELTAKIKAISERNYNQKLEINSHDELGELASAFNIMSVRLKEYEQSNLAKLLFEKKRMDAVIQNLQDGVIIIDKDKKIIHINKTALSLSGSKEEDVIDHNIAEVANKNDLIKEIIDLMAPGTEVGRAQKPIKIIMQGKEQFYSVEDYDISINSGTNEGSNVVGSVFILRNITSFQQRDAAKTNLIATVSHEFKTPLSSINLSLKLLEDNRIGQLNDEQKKIMSSIRTQNNRLSKVVNELLDYSQAETGNIRLKLGPVRPEDVVDLSITALMMLISEKNIQLETKIEENLPDIHADLEKTVWVLVNILSNAIRFTPNNQTIHIAANLEKDSVYFSVKDEGPGISEEELPRIFDKFVQVGKATKGTGLGLTISKEFVQAQRGKIWVESKFGEGSKFIFCLPIFISA